MAKIPQNQTQTTNLNTVSDRQKWMAE